MAFQSEPEILKRDMPINIGISALLCIMLLDGKLSRIEGALLLAGMAAYIAVMVITALKNRTQGEQVVAKKSDFHHRGACGCYIRRKSCCGFCK